MEDPSALKMRYEVIGSRKPKRVSKGPWENRIGKGPRKPKESKWAKDAQGKQMGQGCPRGKWDTGARKQCNKRPSEHTKSLGGKQIAGLKRPSKIELNNIIAGIT